MRRNRNTSTAGQRRQRSRLAQLVSQQPLLRGNLVQSKRKCGKPHCRCQRGHLHSSSYLYLSIDGKPQTVYIPSAWQQRVEQWVKDYQEVRLLLEQLSSQQLRKLRQREE